MKQCSKQILQSRYSTLSPEATPARLHTHTGIPKIATVRLTNSDNLCEILEITLSRTVYSKMKKPQMAQRG